MCDAQSLLQKWKLWRQPPHKNGSPWDYKEEEWLKYIINIAKTQIKSNKNDIPLLFLKKIITNSDSTTCPDSATERDS